MYNSRNGNTVFADGPQLSLLNNTCIGCHSHTSAAIYDLANVKYRLSILLAVLIMAIPQLVAIFTGWSTMVMSMDTMLLATSTVISA